MDSIQKLVDEIKQNESKINSLNDEIEHIADKYNEDLSTYHEIQAEVKATSKLMDALDILEDVKPSDLTFAQCNNYESVIESLRAIKDSALHNARDETSFKQGLDDEKRTLDKKNDERIRIHEYVKSLKVQLNFKLQEMDDLLQQYRKAVKDNYDHVVGTKMNKCDDVNVEC